MGPFLALAHQIVLGPFSGPLEPGKIRTKQDLSILGCADGVFQSAGIYR